LTAEISAYGVTDYEIDPHGSHRTLLFTYNGRPVRLVYGTNRSDPRHLLNAVSDLHRAMGVKRTITKRAGPRPAQPRRRPAAPASVLSPPLATLKGDDWTTPLQEWMAKFGAAAVGDVTGGVNAAGEHRTEVGTIRLICPQFGRRVRWQEPP
jgi:hypothetical protein